MPDCWFSFEDGHHTCILPKDHDGPHEPTDDDDIIIGATPRDSVGAIDTDSDKIREAIAAINSEDGVDPYLIGDITLIAEMIGPDTKTYLFHLNSQGLTVWKERGMLMYRLDMLAGASTVTEIERSEDEGD